MNKSSYGCSVSAHCLLLTLFFNAQLLTCRTAPHTGCLDSERKSLLKFKTSLDDPDNRLSSWKGLECCAWRGVSCDNQTGLVVGIDLHNPFLNNDLGVWNLSGEIDPSLLQIKSLNYLDLSGNSFNNIPVPKFIGSITQLRYLNLSRAGFTGTVPAQLGNLSRLQYLDLSSSYPPLMVDDIKWVSRLSSLVHLSMDGVDLSMIGADWIHSLNRVFTLREMHLSGCGLSGIAQSLPLVNLTSLAVMDLSFNSFNSTIPNWVLNLSSLVHVDMSNTDLSGSIPVELSELPNLSYLDLSMNGYLAADCSKLLGGHWRRIEYLKLWSNMLYGSLPESIGNISSLVDLDFFDNKVEGGVPSSVGKLCHLETMNLVGNNLSLGLPESLEKGNGCNTEGTLPNLSLLSLSNNQLTGTLPEWLGELRAIVELHLSYNSIRGPIPSSIGNLLHLTRLGLQGNELNGTLPQHLGKLSNLVTLDISMNQLTGTVTETHFSNLRNLKILSVSSNSLIMNITSGWIPPFQVRNLGMGSCQLGPQFPLWLQHQRELEYLDLSNASISGEVPLWFWDLSSNLSLLNVSFNRIEGQLPSPLKVASFADIDMRSNLLSGPLPILSNEVELLDLSHNQFIGPIPPNIGELHPNLIYLSLSNNNLTGTVPASIGEMQGLQVIDLSRNNLMGSIPQSLQNCTYLKALGLNGNNLFGEFSSLGKLKQLKSLHLDDNILSGEIPLSLRNCSSLETLDIGDNKLDGEIPFWIGESFPVLRILRLRSNEFSGHIPSQLSNLISLQVLDLAENELVGTIPRSFGDLKAMAIEQRMNQYLYYGLYRGNYYEESMSMSINGKQLIYTKTLSLLTSIDLSGNKLTGDFPEALTNLIGLLVLNLSGNRLDGRIPDRIGRMREMLSLDLSSNLFSGVIPPGMNSMNFLSHLNLSNNNFSGSIPTEGQLGTFVASSFYGNPFLCGIGMLRCEETQGGSQPDNEGNVEDDDDKWFELSGGLGFAVGLLGAFAVTSIRKPWTVPYFKFVDWVADGIAQVMHVRTSRPRQQQRR